MVRSLASLPGADLVSQGLRDLAAGDRTIAALLVSIGAPRLRTLGFDVVAPIEDADHELYLVLASEDADGAHSRYNALVRTLVSFERAVACAG